eukprot:Sdes_comp13801_c0_seq1m3296
MLISSSIPQKVSLHVRILKMIISSIFPPTIQSNHNDRNIICAAVVESKIDKLLGCQSRRIKLANNLNQVIAGYRFKHPISGHHEKLIVLSKSQLLGFWSWYHSSKLEGNIANRSRHGQLSHHSRDPNQGDLSARSNDSLELIFAVWLVVASELDGLPFARQDCSGVTAAGYVELIFQKKGHYSGGSAVALGEVSDVTYSSRVFVEVMVDFVEGMCECFGKISRVRFREFLFEANMKMLACIFCGVHTTVPVKYSKVCKMRIQKLDLKSVFVIFSQPANRLGPNHFIRGHAGTACDCGHASVESEAGVCNILSSYEIT